MPSNELSLEDQMVQQAKHAIKDAIREKLGGYSSPLNPVIERCVKNHEAVFVSLIDDAIKNIATDQAFRNEVVSATRTKLAKVLVDKLGGEIEKRVNDIKANPTTRARITLAIEAIAASQGGPNAQ